MTESADQSGGLRVALVHDFLLDLRGAERVFLAMCEIWPEADVFTAVYDEEGTEGRFAHRRVHTSFLQKLRPDARTFRALLPFYPSAIESFDLSGYDLVVSSSSAWAHAVICDPSTPCTSRYCHNPFRYAWNDRDRTLAERATRSPARRCAASSSRWRQWDWIAAQRVDRYLANSRDHAGAHPRLLRPRVDGRAPARRDLALRPGPPGDYYLVLSELMPHKRIDVAVRGLQRAAAARWWSRATAPTRAGCGGWPGPTITFAGRRQRRARPRALLSGLPRAGRHRGRGVRHRGRRGAGRRAARDLACARAARSRRCVEGVTGVFWEGGRRSWPTPSRASTPTASTPAPAWTTRARFDVSVFKQRAPTRGRPGAGAGAPVAGAPRAPSPRPPGAAWARAALLTVPLPGRIALALVALVVAAALVVELRAQRLLEGARDSAGDAGQRALSPDQRRDVLADLESAGRLRPGTDALVLRARIEVKAGRFEQAVALARRAVAKEPESYLAWAVLTYVLIADGDHAAARQALERAKQLNPLVLSGT